MHPDTLPRIDEHATDIAATPDTVWRALTEALDGSFAGPLATRYSRLVGCTDRTASGPRPLAEGSALPGFHVTTATPNRTLALRGAHRFSAYTLTFHLEPTTPGHTHVRAETRAVFPGPPGTLYRALVIRTGFHAAGMRRLMAAVARAAG